MKQNFTSINVVLDRSGSMAPIQLETISSFNRFLQEQKEVPGDAIFTLATFDDKYTLVHDCISIKDVPELTTETYKMGGYTALLDAMGKTINATGSKLSAMKEEDRPSKVIFLIITDGEENASKEFIHSAVKEMVEHQSSKYSWEFIFMGATGIDAVAQGSSMGISAKNSYSFSNTKVGTQKLYSSLSANMTRSRTTSSAFSLDPNDLKDTSNDSSKDN